VGTFGAWHYNPINLQTGLAITELGPNTGSDINNHYNLIAMNLQTLWTQFEGRLLTSWNNLVTGLGASAGVRAACHVYAPARKGAVSSSFIGLAAAPGRRKF
jgi:hypothetical protein